MRHVEKAFSVKTIKAHCKFYLANIALEYFGNRRLCLAFVGLCGKKKNAENDEEAVQGKFVVVEGFAR